MGTHDACRRRRRPRQRRQLSVHGAAIISAFAGVLLGSTPRSDALLAIPSAPGAIAVSSAAAVAVGKYTRQGRRQTNACSTAASTSAFAGMQSPSSKRAGPGCNRLMVMSTSSVGGDEGADGEGESLNQGDLGDLGVVIEGAVVRSSQHRQEGRGGGDGEEQEEEGEEVMSSSEPRQAVGDASEEAGSETEKDSKKKKTKRPRLKGEALRDELMRREAVEENAVLDVNMLFYRARAYKEIDDLKEVWDKSDLSECIRNVGGVLKGYNDIIEDYKTEFILAKKQEKPGLRPFKIKNLKVQTCGTLAWVTCIEDMRNPYKPFPKTVQLVTNVFRKTSKGWRLARHHASDRDVAVQKGSQGGPTVSSLVGGGGGKQPRDGQSGNSLLSHFVDENGQVTELSARMFRVSDGEITPIDVSELSVGGNDNNDDDDFDGEITISTSDSDGEDGDDNSVTGSGSIPPFLRKLIQDKIKEAVSKKDLKANARRRDGMKTGGLKEGVDWEFRDGVPVVRDVIPDLGGDGWGESPRRSGRPGPGDNGRGSAEEDEEGGARDNERGVRESRELTRETVDAVRKLAGAGKIKENEKRLLLADVIRNASSDGPSITEVAFEVLVGGELGRDFDTNGCEEFVDQCKAFAIQLSDEQKSKRRPWWKFFGRG